MKKKKGSTKQYGTTEGKIKLLERLMKSGKKVSLEGSESVNMTKVFREFCEPLMNGSVSEDKILIAVQFALLIWNASMMPSPAQENMIQQILQGYTFPGNSESLKYTLDLLLKRKKAQFDEFKKFIVDIEFSGHGKELRFDVVTTDA